MKKMNKPILLVLFASVLRGTTGSSQAFAPTGASPLAIGAIRMLIGGTFMLVMACLSGHAKPLQGLNYKTVLLAALCMALYQPLFFSGVSQTGIAIGTMLAIGSAPVFSGLFDLVCKEKPSKNWTLGTGLSLTGCIFIFGLQKNMQVDMYGALLSLGAGLSYSLYVKFSSIMFSQSPRLLANALVFFISGILLLPLLAFYDFSWVFTLRGSLVALHLGLITTALAYSLFAKALMNISSSKAVTLTLAEPLTASLLGFIIFKEQIDLTGLIGIIMLICGLFISTLTINKKTKSFDNLKNSA